MERLKNFFSSSWKGLLLCLVIAIPCWGLGKLFPVIGGPIFGIIAGMIITLFIKDKTPFDKGISFSSKTILQTAVVLLGFGLNLSVVAQTGLESLPIICCTIAAALLIAFFVSKALKMDGKLATLIGVGSSICGGSAIAATAPVIHADDKQVAQSISVIFFFNLIAALTFPALGTALGFDTTSGSAFGLFAGTAINDTSSVTAAASSWDSIYGLGTETLDYAVTVKLTRTLAIIPIVLVLGVYTAKKDAGAKTKITFKQVFPMFILYFLIASLITTILTAIGVPGIASVFSFLKECSKFCIVWAMVAIGLNTNIVELVKTGGKPIALGACCWAGIIATSLISQKVMGIW